MTELVFKSEKAMKTDLQLFNNPKFGEVRVSEINGKPYFVANDVAKALGYTNPSKATNDHCKRAVMEWGNDSLGRRQEFKFIPEGDLYRLAAKSQLPGAEEFESWIFDEVLPSIRRTGGYLSASEDETPEELMAKAIMVAQDTLNRREQRIQMLETETKSQQKQIDYLTPKADFVDKVLAPSNELVDVGQAAKLLKLPYGRNTFFKKLRDSGIFFKNRNEPKQEYVKLEYFKTYIDTVQRNNHPDLVVIKVLITQKGLAWLNKMFGTEEVKVAKTAKIM